MTATAAPSDDVGPAALAYARTGLRVYPVARNKHPLTDHGKNDATTDEETITEWWRRWPLANVGALTGRAAGFFVLDIDPRHGGDDSLDALQARNGPLPSTLTCRTGGGGAHHYLAHPGGDVKTSTFGAFGSGLDVLGERASVILPPSVHASGVRYSWLDSSTPIAAAPAWLVSLVCPAPRPASRSRPARAVTAATKYARRALDAEAARVRAAVEGTRNPTLNRAAFNLGQLVAADVLAEEVVFAVLLDATALPESEARGTIASGVRAGKANPRRVTVRR